MDKLKAVLERRGTPRFPIKLPVKYRLELNKKVLKKIEDWKKNEKNAYTLDVSLGGMRIAVDQPLEAGNVIQFDIYLLDKSNIVKVYANVIRADKESASLKFLIMKDEERDALKCFLEKIS